MGSRFVCCCLNRSMNNYVKIIRNNPQCLKQIHSICGKKEMDLECKLTTRVSLYSSGDVPKKCWQCNFPFKSELFCSKCQSLQEPPEELDYFDILGIKKSFNIELKDLQMKYKKLQSILHPDKFGNRSDKEKDYSENLSSLLNKAYETLSHPLERGLYLLKLQNISIPEGSTNLNPEFLMTIMELNEEIEQASTDKNKIIKLLKENNLTLESLSNEISVAFDNGDIEKAQSLLVKMKYYASMDKRLKNIKLDLEIID